MQFSNISETTVYVTFLYSIMNNYQPKNVTCNFISVIMNLLVIYYLFMCLFIYICLNLFYQMSLPSKIKTARHMQRHILTL